MGEMVSVYARVLDAPTDVCMSAPSARDAETVEDLVDAGGLGDRFAENLQRIFGPCRPAEMTRIDAVGIEITSDAGPAAARTLQAEELKHLSQASGLLGSLGQLLDGVAWTLRHWFLPPWSSVTRNANRQV